MSESQTPPQQSIAMAADGLNPTITTWLRLMRVHTRINGRLTHFLRAWDLPMAQFDALVQIVADEGICQQDLAARLMETKGNISRLLDRLVARGWLERRSDGHVNRLYLTPAGQKLAAQVIPAQNALITRLFASMPSQERAELHRILRHFEHTLRDDASG